MTREELRDYVEEQRNLDVIPSHVYSTLVDGIDTLEQESFDGLTNGEVMQTVFPNCLINKTDNWVNIHIDTLTPFSREWWNAPYNIEK